MAELDLVPIEARLDAWIRQRRSFSLPTFANSIDYVAAKEQFIARAPEDIAALVAEVERLRAKLKKLSTLPTVEAKGPNDTDAGRFLIAARNLEDGEYIGGSCTRRAVASLIRRDVDIALNGEES